MQPPLSSFRVYVIDDCDGKVIRIARETRINVEHSLVGSGSKQRAPRRGEKKTRNSGHSYSPWEIQNSRRIWEQLIRQKHGRFGGQSC